MTNSETVEIPHSYRWNSGNSILANQKRWNPNQNCNPNHISLILRICTCPFESSCEIKAPQKSIMFIHPKDKNKNEVNNYLLTCVCEVGETTVPVHKVKLGETHWKYMCTYICYRSTQIKYMCVFKVSFWNLFLWLILKSYFINVNK